MSTSVSSRRSIWKLLTAALVMILLPVSGLLNVQTVSAAYQLRYSTITTGAMTFTGNTLGLSKAVNTSMPSTSGGIGAFITTNTALRDGAYPFGTTGNWTLNSSTATLNMPIGSKVLYAELIWSGSYSYGGEDVSTALNNAVTLKTPDGSSFTVAPDPATAQTFGSRDGAGRCTSDPEIPSAEVVVVPCFYVRSANVTPQVQSAGAGSYTIGRVPATQSDRENFNNNAGWTLAVAYKNLTLPTRSLALLVGAELTNATTSLPITIAGFCTPPTGAISGRLLLSAMGGDASIRGDQMQFGPTIVSLVPISGPNNPLENFFASQINNDNGTIDTSGTFGTINPILGGSMSGVRQGWNITNIDISGQLANSQTSAVYRGTATQDQYLINGLGTQIDIAAPQFPINVKTVDKAKTFVGDFLTYTIQIDNTDGTANADNVLFKNTPSAGTSFVAGSFLIDGRLVPDADPSAGVSIGTITMGTRKIVSFRVRVDRLSASLAIPVDNSASWIYDYTGCFGEAPIFGSLTTNQAIHQRISPRMHSIRITPR
jgi:large repetitive protein